MKGCKKCGTPYTSPPDCHCGDPKTLRERCEKLADKLGVTGGYSESEIEAFAREIRNEALEEAARLAQKDAITPGELKANRPELCDQIRALATTLAAAGNSEKVER